MSLFQSFTGLCRVHSLLCSENEPERFPVIRRKAWIASRFTSEATSLLSSFIFGLFTNVRLAGQIDDRLGKLFDFVAEARVCRSSVSVKHEGWHGVRRAAATQKIAWFLCMWSQCGLKPV